MAEHALHALQVTATLPTWCVVMFVGHVALPEAKKHVLKPVVGLQLVAHVESMQRRLGVDAAALGLFAGLLEHAPGVTSGIDGHAQCV